MSDAINAWIVDHPNRSVAVFAVALFTAIGLAVAGFLRFESWLQRRRDASAGNYADDTASRADDRDAVAPPRNSTHRPIEWTEADDQQVAAMLGHGPDGRRS